MSKKETEEIFLKSETPFENAMAPLDKGYYILGAIGFIAGIIISGMAAGGACLALMGLVLWWGIKRNIALAKWKLLRYRQFHMDRQLPSEELLGRLVAALTPYGLRVDSSEGLPSVAYKNIRIKMEYNQNGTFSLPWSQNPGFYFFDYRYITSYLNTVAIMSIVAYQVQRAASAEGAGEKAEVEAEQGTCAVPQIISSSAKPAKKKFIMMAVIGVLALIVVLRIVSTDSDSSSHGGKAKTSESVSATDTTTAAAKAENTDAYEFYDLARAANEGVPYEISEKAGVFLKEHSDLFPISADKFLKDDDFSLVDTDLEAKHIFKNKDKYGDKLMSLPVLGVTQIWEGEANNADGYYSAINAVDESGQQYFIIYNGELDIFENDYISCFGLPLDVSSFENTDGGDTLVVVLAGSVIEKIQDTETATAPAETEATPVVESAPETQAQSVSETNTSPSKKSISIEGTWSMKNIGGGNTIEISKTSEGYDVSFSGSYYDDAGGTDGVMYDDGGGHYRYYDEYELEAGGDNPAFELTLDRKTMDLTVDSVMGDTYGGMNFPGFSGNYTKQ